MSDFFLYTLSMEKTVEKNNEHTIEYYKERTQELEAKLKWYEEQFRLLQKQKYGTSSEKTNDNQMSLPLFNEVEDTADSNVEEPALDTITYQRKKSRKTRDDLWKICPWRPSTMNLLLRSRSVRAAVIKHIKRSEEHTSELQ